MLALCILIDCLIIFLKFHILSLPRFTFSSQTSIYQQFQNTTLQGTVCRRNNCYFIFINNFADNIALNQQTYHSTIYGNYVNFYGPQKAVDGKKNPEGDPQPCYHTEDNQMNPWWAVDIQRRRLVGTINITNRADCCGMIEL